jgi:hypothetical protein
MANKLKILLIVTLFIIPTVIRQEKISNQTVSKEIMEVRQSVSKLAPHLSAERQIRVASAIYSNAKRYNISKRVLLSIIKIESNFKSSKVSSTGDYSIVQINLKIWNKEFKRLGLPAINKSELLKNDDYAISKMCHILSIIKGRHLKDKQWYARYHSNTPEYNLIYQSKINKVMKLIASK